MKRLTIILLVLIFFFSCEKELDLKGTIKGSVELSVRYEGEKPAEGARVVLENQYVSKEAFVNEEGMFRLDNIDEGYYNLSFSYEGYGTYKIYNYAFIGLGKNVVMQSINLYRIPEFDTQNAQLSLTANVNDYTVVEGFITCLPGQGDYIDISLYFDQDPEVSIKDYTYSTFDSGIKWVQGDTIFIKDFIKDLKKNEKWFVSICISDRYDYKPPTTLKKACNTLEITVK